CIFITSIIFLCNILYFILFLNTSCNVIYSLSLHDALPILTEFQVGRDDQAFLLIPLGNELEKQFRSFFSEREVTHFIQYNQIHFLKSFSECSQFILT